MKQNYPRRSVFQIITFMIACSSLIALSILTSTDAGNNLYLPLISLLWPSEPGFRSPILITEVMYNPSGHEPEDEWIELYNRGFGSVNLGNYKIGDSETPGDSEGMFFFPEGAIINPGQVIVVGYQALAFSQNYGFVPDFEFSNSHELVPDMVKDKSWASGNVNLNNSGDEILLFEKDHMLDMISWGDSIYAFSPSISKVEEGHSIERKPADCDWNHAADWIEQSDPQPGKVDLIPPTLSPSPTNTATPTLSPSPTNTTTPTPTLTPPPPVLVLNEIHADPHPDLGDANFDGEVNADDDEFIEILNNSPDALDLSGWKLGDYFGIRHTFPIDSIIQPGCGVVVFGGGDPDDGIDFGNCLVQVASSGSLGLNSSGDVVYIYDSTDAEVTSYSYGPEAEDKQSITRAPDIIGEELVKHSLAPGSGGSLYSPGTKIDGSFFDGCSE